MLSGNQVHTLQLVSHQATFCRGVGKRVKETEMKLQNKFEMFFLQSLKFSILQILLKLGGILKFRLASGVFAKWNTVLY